MRDSMWWTLRTAAAVAAAFVGVTFASAGDPSENAPRRDAAEPLSFDDQWTPKGDGPAEVREKEADWRDGRLRESETGPFFTASIAVPDIGAPRGPFVDRLTPAGDRGEAPGPAEVVKALAIRLGGDGGGGGGRGGRPQAAVLFDKETMTLRCGWTGAFLEHSAIRFGLLESPQIGGELAFASVPDGWERDGGDTAKVGREWRGLYRHGDQAVLAYAVGGREVCEVNGVEGGKGDWAFSRTMEIGPGDVPLRLTLATLPGSSPRPANGSAVVATTDRAVSATAVGASVAARGDRLVLALPAGDKPLRVKVLLRGGGGGAPAGAAPGPAHAAADLEPLTRGGPRLWGEPLVTRGEIGKPGGASPFAVDTIALPYDNPHKALFFVGGFDFAPDGACYVATAHGDVWRVTGIDEDLDAVRWQRFATGLYQPLGLKVRGDEVFVLGRDQVTRLHDLNADGEADFYENFNDDLTDHGQPHAYAMCLETDAAGNFYFLKSGAPKTPHGGTLLRLSADGKQLSVIATGFRHANGLSVGPDGTITTADNEGNWVPATRLDVIEPDGFYGHVPTAHLDAEPTGPGLPLCWLPRGVDNSAGGQAWVPEGSWGSLSGALLHLSFGRCTAHVILRERVDGVWQGGAVRLPTPRFLSGVHRGRFRTGGAGADGHLYLGGLNGWSSEAAKDGCLQRVRYVGGPVPLPTGVHAHRNGIELTFAEPLDAKLAGDPRRYAVSVWNYQWTKNYGSKDYRADDAAREGRTALKVTSATPSADARRVFIAVEGLAPVMQLRIQAGLRTAAGVPLPVDYYGTAHRLGPTRP